MDDLDLVRRCVLGDAEAWGDLVRGHVAVLHAAASRIVGPVEAEDVLQALFLKLWEDGRRRLKTFQGRSRLSTWLVAVARREALDHARAKSARDRASPPAIAAVTAASNGHAPSADAGAETRETMAALLAALDRLPPRDRLLVRLVHVDGRTYRDVARLLAVPENSISPWLSRARERLEGLLTPRQGAPRQPPPRTDSAPKAL